MLLIYIHIHRKISSVILAALYWQKILLHVLFPGGVPILVKVCASVSTHAEAEG